MFKVRRPVHPPYPRIFNPERYVNDGKLDRWSRIPKRRFLGSGEGATPLTTVRFLLHCAKTLDVVFPQDLSRLWEFFASNRLDPQAFVNEKFEAKFHGESSIVHEFPTCISDPIVWIFWFSRTFSLICCRNAPRALQLPENALLRDKLRID